MSPRYSAHQGVYQLHYCERSPHQAISRQGKASPLWTAARKPPSPGQDSNPPGIRGFKYWPEWQQGTCVGQTNKCCHFNVSVLLQFVHVLRRWALLVAVFYWGNFECRGHFGGRTDAA